MSHLTAISYGGGVQTKALAILAAQGKVARPDAIIFADPGDEEAGTYTDLDTFGEWLAGHGLRVTVAQSNLGPLSEYMKRTGTVVIPAYGSNGGQLPRACTERWKIRVVRQELRRLGATTATVMLGISLDEIHRAKDSDVQWASNAFPLLDLRLTRADCIQIIEDAALPVPPKSACTFCPFRTPKGWAQLRQSSPAAFAHAEQMEDSLPGLFLHSSRQPLRIVADNADAQPELFEEDGCTSGHCFV